MSLPVGQSVSSPVESTVQPELVNTFIRSLRKADDELLNRKKWVDIAFWVRLSPKSKLPKLEWYHRRNSCFVSLVFS